MLTYDIEILYNQSLMFLKFHDFDLNIFGLLPVINAGSFPVRLRTT